MEQRSRTRNETDKLDVRNCVRKKKKKHALKTIKYAQQMQEKKHYCNINKPYFTVTKKEKQIGRYLQVVCNYKKYYQFGFFRSINLLFTDEHCTKHGKDATNSNVLCMILTILPTEKDVHNYFDKYNFFCPIEWNDAITQARYRLI